MIMILNQIVNNNQSYLATKPTEFLYCLHSEWMWLFVIISNIDIHTSIGVWSFNTIWGGYNYDKFNLKETMIQFSLAISDYRLLPLFKKNFLIITSIHQDVVFPIIFCKINHPTCFGMKPTLITGYNIQASANIYPVLPNPCFS